MGNITKNIILCNEYTLKKVPTICLLEMSPHKSSLNFWNPTK